MGDVRERFRTLDRIPTPDLWPDIERREPADLALGPSWRRVGVATLAFVVAAAGIGAAGWAFLWPHDTRGVVHPRPGSAVRNGDIWFTVSFPGEDRPASLHRIHPNGSGDQVVFADGRDRTVRPEKVRPVAVGGDYDWSPDGSQVAFTNAARYRRDGSPFTWELFLMRPDGSGFAQLTVDNGLASSPSWSPNGGELAYASARGRDLSFGCQGSDLCPSDIYVHSAGAASERRLTDDPADDSQPDWSPDGTRIVFVSGRKDSKGDLYVMGADRSERRDATGERERAVALTDTLDTDRSPRWSPDGRRIAFARVPSDGSSVNLFAVRADGSGLEQLTHLEHCEAIADIEWSPDGRQIAFSALTTSFRLFVMNADGSGLRMIGPSGVRDVSWRPVPTSPPRATSPAAIPISALPPIPQASSVGDIAYQTGFHSEARIWVMHPDGSDPHRIAVGSDPAWSPDGKRIAYRTSFVKDRYDLAVANADGSEQRTLVHDASIVRSLEGGAPAWSPDGHTIAFATNEGLFVVPAEGGEARLLADSADCLENDPAWSPDGSRIVFDAACTEETSDARAGLIVINADGTGWHRIVGPDGFAQFPPSSPAWSPDGQHIAFDTVRGEGISGTIFIAQADGSDVFALTEGVGPAWSPDGSRIAFAFQDTRFEIYSHIYLIGVDGSGRHRITSAKAPTGQAVIVDVRALASNPSWEPTLSVP